MGMKSARSHVQSDYVLFVPCDVTYIPSRVLLKLHRALAKNSRLKWPMWKLTASHFIHFVWSNAVVWQP